MIQINCSMSTIRYFSFMYICICHAVTDSTIRKAVHEGASSFRELSFSTGCGTQCGSCVPQAREIMNGALTDLGVAASVEKLSVVSSG
jgi:bacterioferritin-associated ferredoxin